LEGDYSQKIFYLDGRKIIAKSGIAEAQVDVLPLFWGNISVD
jgi:hypothetical protein